jgi:pentatricopeptide repeat protein
MQVLRLLGDAEKDGVEVDTYLCNYALRMLSGSASGAEAIFQWMRKRNIRPDVVSWTTAIRLCQEAKEWERALYWVGQMEAAGVPPNGVTFGTMIHMLSKEGRWQQALEILRLMDARGLRNVMAVTSAMTACEAGGALAEGLELWNELLRQGMTPTVPTLDVAIRLCEKAGDVDRAAALLVQSMDLGLLCRRSHVRRVFTLLKGAEGQEALEIVTDSLSGRVAGLTTEARTTLVEGLCEAGLYKHALSLLRAMPDSHQPDLARLYAMAVGAAAGAGSLDGVVSLYEEMGRLGVARSPEVYQSVLEVLRTGNSSLSTAQGERVAGQILDDCNLAGSGAVAERVLAACVAAKEWDLGLKVLGEISRRGSPLDERTYHHAITILSEKRRGPAAVQLLREMQAKGFQPRIAEYNHAMHACGELHWGTALELFGEVREGTAGVRMDTGTVMAALGACKAGKDWKTAQAMIPLAREHGLEPSPIIYNGVLGVYAAVQMVDKVLETLEEMRFQGTKPDDFTYNTAMAALAKVGDYKRAIRWLSVMSWEGVPASTMTYNCVIDACANGANPGKALEIFNEMKERKVEVDEVTYGSLIHAFAKGGQWEAALRFLDEMRRSSVRPNNVAYCSAMAACNRAGQYSRALALFDQMRRHDDITPDQYTCNEALNACARAGLWERALEMLAEARARGAQVWPI